MARKLEFPIAADTSGYEKAVRNGLIDPTEDAEKAIEDLERTAKRADLDEELKGAQRATEKLDDELDNARDSLKALGYQAKDTAADTRQGMGRAKEGVEELGEEANQTAREAAASFNGSAEDIVDAFQEVAANAFAGFGPAGAIAGLALAAGIGIGLTKVEELTERTEELQEAAREIAFTALEEGVESDEIVASLDHIIERLKTLQEEGQKEFRWFWEEDSSGLGELVRDLKLTGEQARTVADLFELSTDELRAYTAQLSATTDDERRRLTTLSALSAGIEGLTDAERDEQASLTARTAASSRVLEALEREIETRDEAAEASSALADSGAADATRRAAAETAAADAITAAIDSVRDESLSAYDDMRAAAYEKAAADGAAFDVERWLSFVEQGRAAADQYKTNLQAMKLTPAEWENFLSMPDSARQSIAASWATTGETGQQKIREALGDGGAADAGAAATVAFDAAFSPTDSDVSVSVSADTATADRAIDRVASKTRTARILARSETRAAEAALARLTRTRTARVRAVADTRAWDRWNPRPKTARLVVHKVDRYGRPID